MYLFIYFNFIVSFQEVDSPDNRKHKSSVTAYHPSVFQQFHDYYYDKSLLQSIQKNYSSFGLSKMIKNNNEEKLKICFKLSQSLDLQQKFVKTNLVEFIRDSPLYFNSVVKDIKNNKSEYLSSRLLPLIIGLGLSVPSLFLKKNLRVKIPLNLFLAFFGGLAVWKWQQISQQDINKYYPEKLITESNENYKFANYPIEKLVMDSSDVYCQILENEKKNKMADLQHTIRTNLDPKNKIVLNEALSNITKRFSLKKFDRVEMKDDDEKIFASKIINSGDKPEKNSLIINIFKLIHVPLFFEEDKTKSSVTAEYNIYFDQDEKNRLLLCITCRDEFNKEIYSVYLKVNEDTVDFFGVSFSPDYKSSSKILNNYSANRNTDNITELVQLILSYKYDQINYE